MSYIIVEAYRYQDSNALNNVIKYIMRGSYEEGKGFISYACGVNQLSINHMISSMNNVKRRTNQQDGNQLIHFTVSIFKNKTTSNEYKIGCAKLILETVCDYFYFLGYQIIGAVHVEGLNVHVHFAVNNINLKTGNRMCNSKSVFYTLLKILKIEHKDLKWKKEIIFK